VPFTKDYLIYPQYKDFIGFLKNEILASILPSLAAPAYSKIFDALDVNFGTIYPN
jgi:hypothetical protein